MAHLPSLPWRGDLVSAERLGDVVRSNFWVVPGACVAVSAGAAIGLVELDHLIGPTHATLLYPGPPTGARSFLSSITQAMISFTGVVFSITVVVLQLTSGQFSPRVLRRFLQDRTIQLALGTFVSTFVYSMLVQRTVTGSGIHGSVPRVAVTGAFVLVLASVGLFIAYIDHVADTVRVATIVARIGAEARLLLERRCPRHPDVPSDDPICPDRTPGRSYSALESGVVVSINEGALVRLARDEDCAIELRVRVGDYVPEGFPLFAVHGTAEGPDPRALAAHVAFDTERTMEQDLAFAFRQLVDIAERALSPGINDPTTACQAVDVCHDLLRRLVTRPSPPNVHCDSDGVVRLIVPQYRVTDYLEIAVGEVWHYGSDAAQVPARLRRMLADLHTAARPEHREALERWITVIGEVPAFPAMV